jgi:peroxiredoxin
MKILLTAFTVLLSLTVFSQEKPTGLFVSDIAPDFVSKDQNGKEISLQSLIAKGPVVLVFYRGQWCPYCSRHLSAMEDSLQFISGKGATVLAITPELPENISKTIEKSKASYSIIHDNGLAIMKSYKVSFPLEQSTIDTYKGYGINFEEVNGSSNGNNLPVPAVYIINKEKKIVYRHFDPDYRKRPSIKQIVSALELAP